MCKLLFDFFHLKSKLKETKITTTTTMNKKNRRRKTSAYSWVVKFLAVYQSSHECCVFVRNVNKAVCVCLCVAKRKKSKYRKCIAIIVVAVLKTYKNFCTKMGIEYASSFTYKIRIEEYESVRERASAWHSWNSQIDSWIFLAAWLCAVLFIFFHSIKIPERAFE